MDTPPLFGDPRLPQRFWDKVALEPATGCWIWAGYRNRGGYGVTRPTDRSLSRLAHRYAWSILVAPIAPFPRRVLDHLCRTRACCNPAHLEPVSPGENARRGSSNTLETGICRNGLHPIASVADFWIRHDGVRFCKECLRVTRQRGVRTYQQKVYADPARREEYQRKAREQQRRKLARLREDPAAYEAYKKRKRELARARAARVRVDG